MSLASDLDRFRSEWLASLAGRRAGEHSDPNGPQTGSNPGNNDDNEFFFDTIDKRSLESHSFRTQLLQNLTSARAEDRLNAALRIYEIAVSEEAQGSLGDSLRLYRLALRIDDNVDREYDKLMSARLHIAKTNANTTHAVQSSSTKPPTNQQLIPKKHTPIDDLLTQFASVSIVPEPPASELEPVPFSLFSHLPEDLTLRVLKTLALTDLSAFVQLGQVCKRFAYIVAKEEPIWRRVAEGPEFGFSAMHHDFVCSIRGRVLINRVLGSGLESGRLAEEPGRLDTPEVPAYMRQMRIPPSILPQLGYDTYREMVRFRPRVRFNGVYISRVNYTRQGQATSTQVSWSTPVQIVSYFRFLRFYRDGSVLLLLTHELPAVVVPVFYREQIPSREEWEKQRVHRDRATMHAVGRAQQLPGTVPTSSGTVGRGGASGPAAVPTKGAVKPETEPGVCHTLGLTLRGRWRLANPDTEDEEDVHIETESAAPGFRNRMNLTFGKERIYGGVGGNNKQRGRNTRVLEWKGFWYCDSASQQWSEFSLSQMKPFVFSRVRSYGNGLEEVDVPV